jgi:multiple sugar transport system substrate-binding protein/raffinose/stachyose/melibiose transport system substrate-binding protein
MFRKSVWKIVSIAMVGTFVLAACATPTPETIVQTQVVVQTQQVEVTKQVEVPVEVTKEVMVAANSILYNSYNGDPKPRAFDEAIVAAWNEAHPDMPVEQSIIAHEDFKQAIRAYLTADPAPDVLTWFAGNRTRFFVNKGLVLDISDMWKSAGLDQSFAPGFKALATTNDKQYFIPTSYYWWAIYYRPSILKDAGIDQAPETWADLLSACDALSAKGILPISMGAKFKWPAAAWFDYLNMRLNGPQFHIDLTDLKVPYTDPKVKAVFEKWGELLDHKCIDPKTSAALDWQEAVDPMVQGKAAMYLMGQFIVDSYPDDKENDLDFFRFPIIDPNQPIGEDAPTDGFFMAASAQNSEGGKAFLAYLASKEVQQKAFEDLGRLPTRTDVDISKASPATQQGIKLIQSADMIAQFYDRDTDAAMAEKGMEGFMRFMANPADLDTILADLEAQRQLILSGQ